MVGMSQEQSALFWQSLTWKFVLGLGLVKESICHTSPSLLQTLGETYGRIGVSACRRVGVSACRTPEAVPARVVGRVALRRDRRCPSAKPFPCVWWGRVALRRDRRCTYIEQEQAQNRPTLRRAARHISESQACKTCNAGRAGAQPYQARFRTCDTPTRRHADTSSLARCPRLALFIVKHVFAFWRFVSGCNLG